jgi:carbonic anhydrase
VSGEPNGAGADTRPRGYSWAAWSADRDGAGDRHRVAEQAAEAFADLDEDVRQSIARIKASPFIPHTSAIRGFVFDVATRKLNEVT